MKKNSSHIQDYTFTTTHSTYRVSVGWSKAPGKHKYRGPPHPPRHHHSLTAPLPPTDPAPWKCWASADPLWWPASKCGKRGVKRGVGSFTRKHGEEGFTHKGLKSWAVSRQHPDEIKAMASSQTDVTGRTNLQSKHQDFPVWPMTTSELFLIQPITTSGLSSLTNDNIRIVFNLANNNIRLSSVTNDNIRIVSNLANNNIRLSSPIDNITNFQPDQWQREEFCSLTHLWNSQSGQFYNNN